MTASGASVPLHRPLQCVERYTQREERMGDVFLLGAGFSRAVSAKMPTMKDLFEQLKPLIGQVNGFSKEAYEHADGNVETLLSYYAIRSPCDDSIEVLRKQRVAEILVREIANRLWTREELGAKDGLNPNGEKLVAKWRKQRSHVLTANYDMLVERMDGAMWNNVALSLYPIAITSARSRGGHDSHGLPSADSLTLYKLHGSISWYKSADESSSSPIYGVSGENPMFDVDGKLVGDLKMVGDKRRFIVPPVLDKSTLLSHESICNLWWQAKEYALSRADNLYVIGYSLPETDMAMRTLLWEGRRSEKGGLLPKIPLYVVDKNPSIVNRYKNMLGAYYDVKETYAGGDDAFDRFVEGYV